MPYARPSQMQEVSSLNSSSTGQIASSPDGAVEETNDITTPQRRQISELATQLLATCPGLWTRGYGPRLSSALQRYIDGADKEFRDKGDILSLLEYRFSSMRSADELLAHAQLPLPMGKKCHEWYEQEWYSGASLRLPIDLSAFYSLAVKLVEDAQIFPEPTEDQGRKFYQPRNYIVAALLESSRDRQHLQDNVKRVAQTKTELVHNQSATPHHFAAALSTIHRLQQGDLVLPDLA